VGEYVAFMREACRSLSSTAAVVPSSRFLTSALVEPADLQHARVVVELGPGTGAVTLQILRRLPPDGRLYAIELNRVFARRLRERFNDPRLILINRDACELLSIIPRTVVGRVSAVISSLGLTSMDHRLRSTIVMQASRCLDKDGIMMQYQYMGGFEDISLAPQMRVRRFRVRQFLHRFFRQVNTSTVLLNLPPAFVFECRK
jgi:phosphatidylethanolamine/phosphatidyl-N-methylethanolamine N-methyltransferase